MFAGSGGNLLKTKGWVFACVTMQRLRLISLWYPDKGF
jgi:hypothetical protein